MTFIRPVWAGLVFWPVSESLVSVLALWPGTGAAEKSQEILYSILIIIFIKRELPLMLYKVNITLFKMSAAL